MNVRRLAAWLVLLVIIVGVWRQFATRLTREAALDARIPLAASTSGDAVLAARDEQLESAATDVIVRYSDHAAPAYDSAQVAMLLQLTEGTYLPELLATRDSLNYRWPDRSTTPMRVWVQEGGLPGIREEYPGLVRDAFSTWADAGVPIHFSFVLDSASAEIHVTWIDRFDTQITGRTRWAHDRYRWIVGGSIQLALRQPDDRELTGEAIRAITLHEVGHLIGLDHTVDEAHIMAARVRVPDLSEGDRATARLVYRLPPGSLKAPNAALAPWSPDPARP